MTLEVWNTLRGWDANEARKRRWKMKRNKEWKKKARWAWKVASRYFHCLTWTGGTTLVGRFLNGRILRHDQLLTLSTSLSIHGSHISRFRQNSHKPFYGLKSTVRHRCTLASDVISCRYIIKSRCRPISKPISSDTNCKTILIWQNFTYLTSISNSASSRT